MGITQGVRTLRAKLEEIYSLYNRREYVSPDPLEFLYNYAGDDVEVVGLIASSLAYGRVAQILKSISRVLAPLGEHPARALREIDRRELEIELDGFCHRFVKGPEMAAFLSGIGAIVRERGSLEALWAESASAGRAGTMAGMDAFAEKILTASRLESSHLLPRASKGSACKRLALFLRWMARSDDVDPGCWPSLAQGDIIIPLDTHMYHISTGLGLTSRGAADMRTAIEITDGFAALRPDDPVRYDFALTRYGIREELTVDELLERLTKDEKV